MLQRHQEERTKAPFTLSDSRQLIGPQQTREKFLRQVLRIVGTVTLAPQKSINGIPILAAELLQRGARAFIRCLRRGQHFAPIRSDKPGPRHTKPFWSL